MVAAGFECIVTGSPCCNVMAKCNVLSLQPGPGCGLTMPLVPGPVNTSHLEEKRFLNMTTKKKYVSYQDMTKGCNYDGLLSESG